VQLTVFEPDRRFFDRAEAARSSGIRFELLGDEKAAELGVHDLIVSVGGLSRLPQTVGPEVLHNALAPGGLLLAAEPCPSLFADLVLGTTPEWFTQDTSNPLRGRLRTGPAWSQHLESSGFECVMSQELQGASDEAVLIVAAQGHDAGTSAEPKHEASGHRASGRVSLVVGLGSTSSGLATALNAELDKSISTKTEVTNLAGLSDISPNTTIVFAGTIHSGSDPQEALIRRCNDLKACAEGLGSSNSTIWMLFSGALSVGSTETRPVETGAWAFSRVLANEYPKLDLRRIDLAPGVSPALAARHIRAIIQSGTTETELHSDGRAIRAVRVQRLNSVVATLPRAKAEAVRLQRRATPGQRVSWEPTGRPQPLRGEIEIEVEATGINFRDLMWTLALLPEDMLEDGFSGAVLGLECSGRVSRVGASVKGLRAGDRVLALAANSFSSYVTVKANQAALIPKGMSTAAAATIPVAFMTAYYSLVKLARLTRKETVLIHGGAGAVGMAAIQIAKWRGARIIATAGSTAKRDLLTALGVEHVLDSRSTRFAEEVIAITGSGVDVVLNSLAGEAMEASIACLRPFGRFVELGKRDYVENTTIGLRPFRKNLSYFGVDLDQLMIGRRPLGKAIFNELMRLFERRILTPLPFSTFKGENVAEAFQLMQQSNHIGKIIVLPPAPSGTSQGSGREPIQAEGTHVITGAFGGFGMEAAKWLVDRGIRNLALFGRSGAASPAAQTMLEDFEKRGVNVTAGRLDVSDPLAVTTAFDTLRRTMPPVAGVMHAAMVLDDSMAANLDDEQFRRVTSPKVQGAENLHVATRGLRLDYFVLFSSIATIIGNHGQGNYVAANGYMEGLARNRRLSGLPALAIGWGIISDVGVAAANEKARKNLVKLALKKGMSEADAFGMLGMRAREALDLMVQALATFRESTDPAVITISPSAGRFRKEVAAVLKSPTYMDFVSNQDADETSAIDLRALLLTQDIEMVRRKVQRIVVDQLAKVLHSRPEDVSRTRPMKELGLDSLMTLELAMDLESSIGIDFSLARSVGSLTVPVLVDEIIAQVNLGQYPEDEEPEDETEPEVVPTDAVRQAAA
jgi:NADPH:quinone reductase-like Zn-dependent oxidoreductase/acyl carrier protein